MPDHERPVAVAPVSDPETQSDNCEREIAEDQAKPLQSRRIETKLEVAKRSGLGGVAEIFGVPMQRR